MKSKKKSIVRVFVTLAVMVGVLLGIMSILNKNKAANQAATAEVAKTNPAVAVRVDTAAVRKLDISHTANGIFIPKQEVSVGAETGGRIVSVSVKEGDFVKAGQTLAIIEGNKQNVNVANAQANLENAKMNLERYEAAFATGGVTQQQLDAMRLQYESALNNLKSAKLIAGDVAIRTSVSGIVNARKIEPGSYVNLGTIAFDIVNISSVKLRVHVDEKNVINLKVGQPVQVTVSVIPDKTFTGRITFIAPKAEGGLNFPVEVEIPNPGNELRAGMYGTAHFGKGQMEDVLVVPRAAFVGSVSDNKVFVVENGKAVERKVQSGRSFGDYIEIIDGIKADEQVIVSGQVNLFNNTPIQIIK